MPALNQPFVRSLCRLAPVAVAMGMAAITPAGAIEARSFSEDPDLAELGARWAAKMELFEVPGAAVAVVKDGEVFVQTFGIRNPDGALPVTPDTMFYIASITKTFTAMGVCALEEDGRLSLDDPVKSLLPRFNLPEGHEELEKSITVRDLLCHRYGINSGEIVGLDAYTGDITDERYWYWLERARVAGETAYTNVNFTLAGKVIEQVTGMDWRDWLDERIFAPAGMTRTTGYASELYADEDCAIPMEWTDEGFVPTEQRKTDRTMHAAGGLGISAMDGARWILLNLGDGAIGGKRIIDAGLARSMKAEHSTHEPEGSIRVMDGYGLGWHRGRFADAPMLAHGGGYVGTNAYVAIHPEQNAGFFVLVNAGGYARGWGAAVSVDCSRHNTGMDPPWEPWERYVEQIKEANAEREAPADGASEEPGVTAGHLSRPIGVYTGIYRNEWLGSLVVTREGDTLRFAFGDAAQEFGPAEERDAFMADGFFEDGSIGRFEINRGGDIDRVRIEDAESGEIFVFER